MASIIRFVKNWSLPAVMLMGIAAYFVFAALPFSATTRQSAIKAVGIVQPLLLFCMLFISFCKIEPTKIRPLRWHLWIALIQCFSFVGMAIVARFTANADAVIIAQCAMLCLICPTATAAVVVTDKLGGNTLSIIAYTIIINLINAIIIPAVVPMVNPSIGINFGHSFLIIIKQIFPLLVCPFVLAWIVRAFFPQLLRIILRIRDLAFYLWMVALALAMTVTTRALIHSNISAMCFMGMLVVSLLCCCAQFAIGKRIGSVYNDRISAGQAMGQKNTVFIIWVAYTFMNPVTAVTGGLYSIWHNCINSYQLYKKRQAVH